MIFGTSKLAELAYFYFRYDSPYQVAAFTADADFVDSKEYLGMPLVPFEEISRKYPPEDFKMFVAIGYKRLNFIRAKKYFEAKEKGYSFISYVSSRISCWPDLEVGENCFILEQQVIQPFVKIGDNVIVWSHNHIGHEVVIEEHCFISSMVALCGGAKIGEYTFIGAGATVRDNIKVGKRCIIGAGALIMSNTSDNQVYIREGTKPYKLGSEKFPL